MAELNDETIISVLQDKENCENSLDNSLENSPLKPHNVSKNSLDDGSSDDDEDIVKRGKRRIKQFSDSDSEVDKENKHVTSEKESEPNASDDDIFPRKSRLVANDSSDEDTASPKNESARISDRRSKLHNKFKLLKSKSKALEPQKDSPKSSEDSDGNSSDGSNSGIESIKQKVYQKTALQKSGICDPDTSSDEESSQQPTKSKPRQKSAILTSPKPISKPARMSAKQAMENMQKIKSESNRMLREKEVTLPYHRPKALSLKDIMNRRKPALSADGKALPVKMNSDQLKQYVKILEQRNKEMMELCKSESDEEDETNETQEDNKEQDAKSDNQNGKEETTINDDIKLTVQDEGGEKGEGAEILMNNESEPQTKTLECQEVEKDNKEQGDENTMLDANVLEESHEDDLPDLTVEIVQKEQNVLNTDVAEKLDDEEMRDTPDPNIMNVETNTKLATDIESQLIELRYETEKMQNTDNLENEQNLGQSASNKNENKHATNDDKSLDTDNAHENSKENSHDFNDDFDDGFSDADINMEDLENIIENAKNDETAVDSPMLIRDPYNLNKKPKLTGAPGMVIDLDGSNPVGPKKLTGVELLKERFTYFAKLKTPEEKERERELKIKPGMQHMKLRQELEEKISEQRTLEWEKRLEEDKQQQEELDAIRGDESDGDDLEKIEAKLKDKEDVVKESSSESEEEEEEEETCDIKEKPRKSNPMIDDEAEVSDDEEGGEQDDEETNYAEGNDDAMEDADNEDNDEDSEESSDESSDDETENNAKPKKGRILKAFEDSDDEATVNDNLDSVAKSDEKEFTNTPPDSQIKDTQDDILPLAQVNKSISEDLFGSQSSGMIPSPRPNSTSEDNIKNIDDGCADMTTQSFCISNKTAQEARTESILDVPVNIGIICDSQRSDGNLDDALAMCSGKFTQTQNVIVTQSQIPESQSGFGDDVLAMCTGKFYDNEFVSQAIEPVDKDKTKETSADIAEKPNKKLEGEKDLLDSILQEMDEPVSKEPNRKTYVFDNPTENEAVSFEVVNHVRKKFTIDSDDESNTDDKPVKKKKSKKRKLEKRALQISDDEEDEELQSEEEAVEYMSGAEDDDGVERIVEYDSEENEVEMLPQKQKKGRKMAEFFEQEAELTSEDEWVGSGDEDERDLDRMEREEGDDDKFHEGQLQRELGQIHMRDVLDQDKREVRLIQELLFEDGDLGDGGRQRKFRWKNLDGEMEEGVPELFAESQEEHAESEEQWRKQRHERELFLRNLKENEKEDQNISIDRGSIIKANLCSKTMSSLLLEVNGTKIEETTVVVEKKTKEEPCRMLPLPALQKYPGSLLARGGGTLARLAALAAPLAETARPAPPTDSRNFVFATLTPPNKAKAPKRKAEDVNTGTPRLIKKFKTDDNKKMSKTSLLDHLKVL